MTEKNVTGCEVPHLPADTGMPDVSGRPKKRLRSFARALAAAVLLLGVAGSAAVSTFTLITLKDYIAKQEEAKDESTAENYVIIAEQYEIVPTTDISEAFRSGDTSGLDDKQKETLDMAEAALSEMKITDGMTDFEKEKAVYDWMTTSLQQDRGALTVIPRTKEDCDRPYGVLKYQNAVCVGYATTFRLFMEMLDIECMVAHNSEKYHTWNLVRLDGDWYITDIYSDAGQNSYAHFNMTDVMWGQQQSWDYSFFPAADSLKYNMTWQEKKQADTIYDLVPALREAMDEKKSSVMIGFNEEITGEKAKIVDAITTAVDNTLMTNNYKNMPYCLNSWNWIQDTEDNSYLFCINIGGYNSDGSAGEGALTEAQQKEIQDMINKAFADLTPTEGGEGAKGTENSDTAEAVPGSVITEVILD